MEIIPPPEATEELIEEEVGPGPIEEDDSAPTEERKPSNEINDIYVKEPVIQENETATENVVESLVFTRNLNITEKQHFDEIVKKQKESINSLRVQLFEEKKKSDSLQKQIEDLLK